VVIVKAPKEHDALWQRVHRFLQEEQET